MPDVDVAQASAGRGRRDLLQFRPGLRRQQRLFAQSVFDQVLEGIAATAPFWSRAPASIPTRTGARSASRQHERVLGYIEAGKRDGASVVMGGDVPASDVAITSTRSWPT
jgi:phenylacetaldehyde dehydrogenase